MTDRAALYLRSSKDRSDVSIAAQRRELEALAQARSLTLIAEYVDTVESAKDEHRPGFQSLLRDLKATGRLWTTLLMVDTSRLSRRRYMAQVFKHEARKRGVTLVFARVPDMDPISAVIIDAVLEAFDEVHSLMSREKGLGGMRENVLQGYRAGGRAPRGYRLEAIETGAVREGAPVRKTRLAPDDSAAQVAAYLMARAGGASRARALAASGLRAPETTLIGIERNALTYAGHTVWGVHAEFRRGEGYRGGEKFRPRDEWVIQRDTHPALISEAAAEALLAQLAQRKITRHRDDSRRLLAGLLMAPDGDRWHASAAHYRLRPAGGKSRYVAAEALDAAVLGQLARDLRGRDFARALVSSAKRAAAPDGGGEYAEATARHADLERRVARAMSLATQLDDPGPALREVDRLEAERKATAATLAKLSRDRAATAALASISEADVLPILADLSGRLDSADPARLKDLLPELIEHITLDPGTLEARIHYRIAAAAGRHKLASPRDGELMPMIQVIRRLAG